MTNADGVVPPYFQKQSDEWATPRDLFEELDKEFGFTLDVAATKQNALCANFFTAEDDGLMQPWYGVVWCNPPYSQVAGWVEKAFRESQRGVTSVLLVASRTDTRWWHDFVLPHAEVRFIRGRVRFGTARNRAPFPSALVIFGGQDAKAGAHAKATIDNVLVATRYRYVLVKGPDGTADNEPHAICTDNPAASDVATRARLLRHDDRVAGVGVES